MFKIKRYETELLKALNLVVKSKPEFTVWDGLGLIKEINKRVKKYARLSNTKQVGRLLSRQRKLKTFKHTRGGGTLYIFVSKKWKMTKYGSR